MVGVSAAQGKNVESAGIAKTCRSLEDLVGRSRVAWPESAQ